MHNGNAGETGIFGLGFPEVFDTYFNLTKSSTAPSLARIRWEYIWYTINLKSTAGTNGEFDYALDDYALAAIQVLPPEYNSTTAPAFEAFIENWGTSFTASAKGGGVAEYIGAYSSWLVQQEEPVESLRSTVVD